MDGLSLLTGKGRVYDGVLSACSRAAGSASSVGEGVHKQKGCLISKLRKANAHGVFTDSSCA